MTLITANGTIVEASYNGQATALCSRGVVAVDFKNLMQPIASGTKEGLTLTCTDGEYHLHGDTTKWVSLIRRITMQKGRYLLRTNQRGVGGDFIVMNYSMTSTITGRDGMFDIPTFGDYTLRIQNSLIGVVDWYCRPEIHRVR